MVDKGDKKICLVYKSVHTRLSTIQHQNRKTHQQGMYMLNRTFYERPTEG
jgi:hypothetical protein